MLEISGLRVAYGAVEAVRGMSLTVEAGTITAVLGANGAGKTTLLRTISGLVAPVEGRIELDGVALVGQSVERIVRSGVGHVPEGKGVVAQLTVEENLRLGGLFRADRHARQADLDRCYDLFPRLAERRTQLASTLSGGERQMLSIGSALCGDPRVLLLDEPSLGLAPQIVARIMALIRQLCDETHIGVLLVEQNARSALSVADRAVVVNLGTVVAEGGVDTLGADADLRHAYLGF